MIKGVPFITGKPIESSGLLSRFLPPIPEGIGSKWAADNLENGSWVLDPFGTSPRFALELARAGHKVLISANNPIARFMLDLEAHPPGEDELRSALAQLASARVGEERLEIHLQHLYQSICSQCGQPVIAQAFIWDWEENAPHAKLYECNHCGESGEHPVVQSDIELARSFSASSLHRLRVLERITPPGDSERKNVEEALSVYLPRAIYALVTIVNRLNSLLASTQGIGVNQSIRDKSLIALVLSALDKGNNLWSYPSGRLRPKQLSSSPRFIEENLWFSLENAVGSLKSNHKPVPLSIFPDLPADGGNVILYEGPLRELSVDLAIPSSNSVIDFQAIAAVIPRHNQAFWTLSALWAGWIWGQEAIGTFRSALRRRRYDWSWHCRALNSAFCTLADILPGRTPAFGMIAEAESSFLSAAIIAAERAGFTLNGIALRADSKIAQLNWGYAPGEQRNYQISAAPLIEDQQEDVVVSKVIEHIKKHGEPMPYVVSYTHGLLSIIENQYFSSEGQVSSADEYTRIDQLIEKALSFKNDFVRFGGGEKSHEKASLWHKEIHLPSNTLADKVEFEIYQLMAEGHLDTIMSLDQSICDKFPGLLTPDYELIISCIESYSVIDSLESQRISLRTQDDPQRRTLELASIRQSLCELGDHLGYSSKGENTIIWMEPDGYPRLVFYVSSSAGIGNTIFNSPHSPENSIVVLPGARANLILYKMRHNPILNQEFDRGWRFLKFRHLRHLLESPSLSSENIDALLALDPLTESPAQMRLL